METTIPYYTAELIAEKSWMISNSFSEHTEALCYLVEGRDYGKAVVAWQYKQDSYATFEILGD